MLTIRNRGKGVPYGGSGGPREGGSVNYRFKALNCKPERAAWLAEMQDEEHIRNAVVAISDSGTPFYYGRLQEFF